MNQLFKILTHEKVWAGNVMYAHNMDMKRKEISGTTTVYSESGNQPYLLLSVIPGKKLKTFGVLHQDGVSIQLSLPELWGCKS